MSPPGFTLVYNVNGDQNFHLIRRLPGLAAPAYYLTGDGGIYLNLQYVPTSPGPLETLLEPPASVGGAVPLFLIAGAAPLSGVASPSLGIEVTAQSTSTLTTLFPNLATIMGTGFGGLSLVQTAVATSTVGQASPVVAMCAQQWGDKTLTAESNAACWDWQVSGSSGLDGPDTLSLTRLNPSNNTGNITVLFPAAINLATAAGVGMAGQITVGPQPTVIVGWDAVIEERHPLESGEF